MLKKTIALLVTLAVVSAGAWAQDALSEKQKAQNKLLAQRAARADALRKLSERINGLRLTSETTVKDFVTESDSIRTAMTGFLSGMQEVGRPKYNEDGTCEVTVEVPLETLVVSMERWYNQYYKKGGKIKIEDIRKISISTDVKMLRETGNGAPRPELQEDELVPTAEGASEATFGGASSRAQKYWAAHCQPQGRLMAERAARVEAMRRLVERIAGLQITSETTVKDFVAESDFIQTASNAFLRGAREAGKRYHDDELIVEVEMQVKLRTVYADIKAWAEEKYKGNSLKIRQVTEATLKVEDVIIKETGNGVPPDKYLKDVPADVRIAMDRATKCPPWINETLKAVGNAAVDNKNDNAAQAKLMAQRGAELDARRKLAEQLDGLRITSETSVRDFVAENDEIRTSMLTFQQGARVVDGSQKVMDDGTVQVTVEIELKPLWNSISYYERKLTIKIK